MLALIFDSSRSRDWWSALGRHYFSDDFVQFIEDDILSTAPTDTLWQSGASWTH